jgi:hypothetical protein
MKGRPSKPGQHILGARGELSWLTDTCLIYDRRAGCILISLDNEHLTRLGGIVMVRTPATVLAALLPPAAPSSAM